MKVSSDHKRFASGCGAEGNAPAKRGEVVLNSPSPYVGKG
jgi:hypothetical protein